MSPLTLSVVSQTQVHISRGEVRSRIVGNLVRQNEHKSASMLSFSWPNLLKSETVERAALFMFNYESKWWSTWKTASLWPSSIWMILLTVAWTEKNNSSCLKFLNIIVQWGLTSIFSGGCVRGATQSATMHKLRACTTGSSMHCCFHLNKCFSTFCQCWTRQSGLQVKSQKLDQLISFHWHFGIMTEENHEAVGNICIFLRIFKNDVENVDRTKMTVYYI